MNTMTKSKFAEQSQAPYDGGSMPSDIEIETALKRLSQRWGSAEPIPHDASRSEVTQSLAHGRSHAVTVEVKRSVRRRAPAA